jgi:hypothetical protein
MSLHSLFTEHPASVGETYLQHLRSACGFAGLMFLGGMACLLHAIFPFTFRHTGSDCITRLHERMVIHRNTSAARSSVGRIPLVGSPTAHTRRAGAVAR